MNTIIKRSIIFLIYLSYEKYLKLLRFKTSKIKENQDDIYSSIKTKNIFIDLLIKLVLLIFFVIYKMTDVFNINLIQYILLNLIIVLPLILLNNIFNNLNKEYKKKKGLIFAIIYFISSNLMLLINYIYDGINYLLTFYVSYYLILKGDIPNLLFITNLSQKINLFLK